MFEREEARAIY